MGFKKRYPFSTGTAINKFLKETEPLLEGFSSSYAFLSLYPAMHKFIFIPQSVMRSLIGKASLREFVFPEYQVRQRFLFLLCQYIFELNL